jgi:hypothetical protein
MVWWLVVIAIPFIEVPHWILAMRQPPLARALAVPRHIPALILHLVLLVFALSQVGGFVGAAFASIPQAPDWFYALLLLFLVFEFIFLAAWALRHVWPRTAGARRRSAPVTKPITPGKP